MYGHAAAVVAALPHCVDCGAPALVKSEGDGQLRCAKHALSTMRDGG